MSDITLNNIQWTQTVRRTYRAIIAPSIAFKPAFADLTGSVTAALLLSQAFYWTDGRTTLDGDWFYKTAQQWQEEIRLTPREQTGARAKLRSIFLISVSDEMIPIWEESLRGVPATLHYRVNEVALALALTIMQNGGQEMGGYRLVAPDCLLPLDQSDSGADVDISLRQDNAGSVPVRESAEKIGKTSFAESANPDSRKARNYTIYTESTTEKDQRVRDAQDFSSDQSGTDNAMGDAGQGNTPGRKDNGALDQPLTGLAALGAVRRKDYRHPAQERINQYLTDAAGMGLDLGEWIAYYTSLAEHCGLSALIETGDDLELNQLRDGAISLLKLQVRSLDALKSLVDVWRVQNEWRGNVKPTVRGLAKLQSKVLADVKDAKAQAAAKENNPLIEVEEWGIDGEGNGSWWPATMREKRFLKLQAEGRKIRLPQN